MVDQLLWHTWCLINETTLWYHFFLDNPRRVLCVWVLILLVHHSLLVIFPIAWLAFNYWSAACFILEYLLVFVPLRCGWCSLLKVWPHLMLLLLLLMSSDIERSGWAYHFDVTPIECRVLSRFINWEGWWRIDYCEISSTKGSDSCLPLRCIDA